MLSIVLTAAAVLAGPPSPSPAAAALRIYLARHGQTAWNAERRLQGGKDIPLNDTGREQARALAARLEGIPLDRIYTSALSRSRQTAEPLAGRAPVEALPGLNEQSIGAFEGVYADGREAERYAEFQRRSANPDDALDGGESTNQHFARVRAAVETIRQRHAGGQVLVVGHGGSRRHPAGERRAVPPRAAGGAAAPGLQAHPAGQAEGAVVSASRTAAAACLVAAWAGAACRSAGGVPVAPPSAAPVQAALADPVHWVRTSAEYRALALQTYRSATRALEEQAAGRAAGSWGVILDADETVLDNSQYQKEQNARGKSFDAETWRAWVARREARAVPGAGAFLARVRELGGRIAIVTNRTQAECPDTQANFRALELPWDVMLCKADRSEKEPRFEDVAKGAAGQPPMDVLLFLGDNIQDFPGRRQALRQGAEDGYEPFGRRYFVLPNPMYGSWERNRPE
jgi:5'-nucleotidase (lipoprotein e(P4) family)